MFQILIIEDDEAISNLICTTLQSEGYQCTCAFDGEMGADYMEKGKWDLILLDMMLPIFSGYELLEYNERIRTPVIIISAMGRVEDRIKGLKMGADDYLCKPFQIGELVARVESVLRRVGKTESVLEYYGVMIYLQERCVMKDGKEIKLTVKEFDLLETLVRNKNIALSRCFLYETVWGEEYAGQTRTLDNHIQRLRKKLDWEDVIQTVFRIGYRLYVPQESRR
ncbi:MAG: response regulator transcription factor [Lachnospiraceae bacterium]|nr:response regulator transcription factor [Lachnospiraceae bacterium]